jgi:hypothetical protein
LILATLLLCLSACSPNRLFVRAEHALEVGSEAWDDRIDAKIAECRAQNLPTPVERAACVEPERTIDAEIVAPAMTAVVAALRAYWIAQAAGKVDPAELARILQDLREATADLPPEFNPLSEIVQ